MEERAQGRYRFASQLCELSSVFIREPCLDQLPTIMVTVGRWDIAIEAPIDAPMDAAAGVAHDDRA